MAPACGLDRHVNDPAATTSNPRPIAAPDAAVFLPAPCIAGDSPGPKIYFFKNGRFASWDVLEERPDPGYPRDIAAAWPGLLEAGDGRALRGALHVPAWGDIAYFFFEGLAEAVPWNLSRGIVAGPRIPVSAILPGTFAQGDFTPVYAQRADGEGVIYAFQGYDFISWRTGTGFPSAPEPGSARKIASDWKDGLVLAPRTGVYVEWPNRSAAHSNRKIYFFMGDLYLRWDVPSNTRNYRLDVVTGWKGWPQFT
jgi:hypothetical protein